MNESIYQPPKTSQDTINLLEITETQFKIKDPGKLPSVCVGCGAETNLVETKVKLTYVNPLIFLWILLSPLILIIAYYICRKHLSIQFERCELCDRNKKRWSKISIVAWLVFLISLILRFLVDGTMGFAFALLFIVFFILALFATAMKGPGFSVKSYKAPDFYLRGFKKVFIAKIMERQSR